MASTDPHAALCGATRQLCAALCAGLIAMATPALAGRHAPDGAAPAPAKAGRAPSDKARKPRQPSQQVRIRHQRSSSEETPAQRDRRLYRECQGRPNAGACAGYTRKP